MENKLTDNEIKKALECCIVKTNCNGCPQLGKKQCLEEALENALDLINRLEARYKSVKKEKNKLLDTEMLLAKQVDELQDENYILKADVEKHRAYIELLDIEHEAIKNCAVKEFAERVCDGRVSNDPVVIATKCLLKETVGE